MVVITSRDPEPPGIDYLKAAGGFFRDTTIHDFDLTRFILGDDPVVEISAFGDALFDKNAQQEKDLDTAMFILISKKGVLIHIARTLPISTSSTRNWRSTTPPSSLTPSA